LALPELTIDMDGVVCRPVFWFNLVISRDVARPPDLAEERRARANRLHHRLLETWVGHTLRYAWRPPLPFVREGLAELGQVRRLILLSGRPEASRRPTERWLARHGMREFFSEIILNDRGLPNAAFKIRSVRERGNLEHVDDDGRVAYFLAQEAQRTVFLISYLGNARLPYPPRVHRVRNLLEAAQRIREGNGLDVKRKT
jgi:hypothetical protein